MTSDPFQNIARDFALSLEGAQKSLSSSSIRTLLHSLNNTAGRLKTSAEKRYEDALTSWEEVKPLLPDGARQMATDFVALCQETYAFHCDPECNIDLVDEDSVMFDWNDGTLPMFTALITPSPSIVFVGSFTYGNVKGENSTLDAVATNLTHFVKELGSEIWESSVLQDSWWKKRKVNPEDERVFIPHQKPEGSPSSQLMMPIVMISSTPGLTSRSK